MAYVVKPFSRNDLLPAMQVAASRYAEMAALEQQVGDLHERLETRKALDRAKGILMAAGVSLYAANTSSISYIAIPAKAFETNWQYLTNNLIAVLGLMFVAVWIVPLLRRLDLMSVFSYLETRFHPAIRMLASALAILTQIGSRMSVILLLPALAISTITGLNVTLSIVLMAASPSSTPRWAA